MNVVRSYLRVTLMLGFTRHTGLMISMITSWSHKTYTSNLEALLEADETLVRKYGWHRCPGCTWAVKPTTRHLACEAFVQTGEYTK